MGRFKALGPTAYNYKDLASREGGGVTTASLDQKDPHACSYYSYECPRAGVRGGGSCFMAVQAVVSRAAS